MFNTTVVPSDQNKKQINERNFFQLLSFSISSVQRVHVFVQNQCTIVHPTWDPSRTVVTVLIELQ